MNRHGHEAGPKARFGKKCLTIGADHLVTLTYRGECRGSRAGVARSGTITASTLAIGMLYALCGGPGTQ